MIIVTFDDNKIIFDLEEFVYFMILSNLNEWVSIINVQ